MSDHPSASMSFSENDRHHSSSSGAVALVEESTTYKVASYRASVDREQFQVVRRALCNPTATVPLVDPVADIKMTTGIKSTASTSTEKGTNYLRIPIKAPEHPDSGKWKKNKASSKWNTSSNPSLPEENKGRRLLLHFGTEVRVMPINLYEKTRQRDITTDQELAGMRQQYNTATGVVQLKLENPGTPEELQRIKSIENITMQLRTLLFHNKHLVKKITEFEHTEGLHLLRTRDEEDGSVNSEDEIPVVYMEFLGEGASFMKSTIMEKTSSGSYVPISIEELAKHRHCFTMQVVAQLDSIVLMNNGIWSIKLVVQEALVSRPASTTDRIERIEGQVLHLLPDKPILRPDGSLLAVRSDEGQDGSVEKLVVIAPPPAPTLLIGFDELNEDHQNAKRQRVEEGAIDAMPY